MEQSEVRPMERLEGRFSFGRSLMTSFCPELLCPICKELLECPQTFFASCGHTLCLKCADALLGGSSQANCPVCNHVVNRSELGANPPLAALIKRLTSSAQSERTPSPPAKIETVMSTPGSAPDKVNSTLVEIDQKILSRNDTAIGSPTGDTKIGVSVEVQDLSKVEPGPVSAPTQGINEAWTEFCSASCSRPDSSTCKFIEAEVEKIERLAELARFLLNGKSVLTAVVPSNSNLPSAPAAHESPVNAHRTAEIDAALEAFGLDMGKSVPLLENQDSQKLISDSGIQGPAANDPLNGEGCSDDRKKKPGSRRGRRTKAGVKARGKSSSIKLKEVVSSNGKDSYAELDPLAAAHTSWTQDDNDTLPSAVPQLGKGRGRKPAGGPKSLAKAVGDQKARGKSPHSRQRVKDKTHVHPTVAQTIDMGVPPPEPKKPTKGRRGGQGRKENRKRKTDESPQVPPRPKIRSKRHEIIAENGGMPLAIDDIFDVKLDTIDETQILAQPVIVSPPALPARRHRRLHTKKASIEDDEQLEAPLRNESQPEDEQEDSRKVARKNKRIERKPAAEPKPAQKKRGRKPLANSAKKGKRGPKAKGTKRTSTGAVTSYGAKRQRCQAMVGTSVEIYWDGMDSWYKGQVLHYRARNRDFEVAYEDGEVHWEPLLARQEGSRWRMCTQESDAPMEDAVEEESPATQPNDTQDDEEHPEEPQTTTREICCSDLGTGRIAALKDLCEEIGGGIFVNKINRNTTHLLLGIVEDNHAIKRTEKLMKGVLYGAKIVSSDWLDKSVETKAWVDETPYLVQGDPRSRVNWAETKYNGQMFEGLLFEVENKEGVLFSALREVINAGGGKYTLAPSRLATEQGESYILVVTADRENGRSNDTSGGGIQKIRIRHEWVFDSVSALELLPWDDYRV